MGKMVTIALVLAGIACVIVTIVGFYEMKNSENPTDQLVVTTITNNVHELWGADSHGDWISTKIENTSIIVKHPKEWEIVTESSVESKGIQMYFVDEENDILMQSRLFVSGFDINDYGGDE